MDRIRIVVMPARERAARRRLFDAIEETLPVRFVGGDTGDLAGAGGVFLLADAASQAGAVPPDVPCLVAFGDETPAPAGTSPGPVLSLRRGEPLDARLHGLQLHDPAVADAPALLVEDRRAVLAGCGRRPLWISDRQQSGVRDHVAAAPAELREEECLRDRLCDGRFLAVAALVHFVRAVCAPTGWRPPPLRACFLFDDPNLHWGSYGHLRYRELVGHADRFGYHVAFATVPLDGWWAHPRTARLFRERSDRLSLVFHGNDHTRLELDRPAGAAARRALVAQAVRRIGAFERRSGVSVGRVMVAPHGVCSQEMARELVPFGFDALCISRPYPWLARPPRSWLARPAGSSQLAGWDPASVVDDGLPVLLRRAFSEPVEDLPLRAFLDQPLILYGHHGDMAGGLDRLAELAGVVGRLGDVDWMSPAQIAASNVTTRLEGDGLRVRLFTRRARLQIPGGVARIVVETPSLVGEASKDSVRCGTGENGAASAQLRDGTASFEIDARAVEIRLIAEDAVDAAAVMAPPRRGWKIARRLMVETRDRLTPVYRKTVGQAARGRA
ncbi:MAG TPA: hypothetical protein VGC59_08385 [Solirubrobacteraceae bacterium]